MAAIAENVSYQEKEKKLLRPVNWASTVALFGGLIAPFALVGGTAFDAKVVLCVAIGSNIVNFGLLIWGTRRITRAARGY